MNLAAVNIFDQPSHGIPHCDHVVQGWQVFRVFAGGMAIAPAANPAQFGSLVGDWREKSTGRQAGSYW